jgi:DNA-binding beta-propeller fold protein YncE
MMRTRSLLVATLALSFAATVVQAYAQTIDLSTSKRLFEPVPGSPQRVNNLPVTMAVSPDHHYIVTVDAGYGGAAYGTMQSLTVLNTATNSITNVPDTRTPLRAHQTLYSGLAFSRDGSRLYASIASLTDPIGKRTGDTGSGIAVYSFDQGHISPLRIMKIPLQPLAPGRYTKLIGEVKGDLGVPYPAAIAVTGPTASERLLIADNLSDDALLMDASTGAILHRFDLSQSDAVPGTYPIAVAITHDGSRAFVALWNASEIVELNLSDNTIERKLPLLRPDNPVAPGSHPCALTISPDERTLYVALSNRDSVAAVNIAGNAFALKGYYDTRLPHQTYFGAEPVALALSPQGRTLYVANLATDSIAVFNTEKLTARTAKQGMLEPQGFVPTEWMPLSLAVSGGKLYIATDKGRGPGPNDFPPHNKLDNYQPGTYTYIATLLYGSLASVDLGAIDTSLAPWTAEVLASNFNASARQTITFPNHERNPIKHIIYIIKENRSYDQVFGDLSWHGHPVANGDPRLTMYGSSITPNEHELALQYGVLDNFFVSGEVSGDGHVWSNAAIGSDYLEKTWQQSYRGDERTYDYEGVVANGYPLLQHIPDIDEPDSGYIWGNLARHHVSLYHFAEYIASTFCNDKNVVIGATAPEAGPMLGTQLSCPKKDIPPGAPLPANWGGGVNKWPWAIPLLARNVATKPELVGHFAPEYPDFNLHIPDQVRVNIFLRHLRKWIIERQHGHDTMPTFIQLRLPNDHTAGTTPGGPTPASSVADNDLAVGRAIDAISHSPYWNDTAFFILEDDAQNGADHVDAHRSPVLVVSKYAPRNPGGAPYVDSHFYTTVSVIHTMESLLGLPPMNNNDAFSPLIASLFSGPGTQPPFNADYANKMNGLIYKPNPPLSALRNNPVAAAGERASMKMDFSHADRANWQKLNVILWQNARGNAPVPPQLLVKHKKQKEDDDD